MSNHKLMQFHLSRYIQCHISCASPIITTTCKSREASELLEDFVASTYSEQGRSFLTLGLYEIWPDSCRQLSMGEIGGFVQSHQGDASIVQKKIEPKIVPLMDDGCSHTCGNTVCLFLLIIHFLLNL